MSKKVAGKELRFASRADFDAAVNSATDEAIVILDGATVRGGVEPAIRFVTAADGGIELQKEAPAALLATA